MGPANLGSRMRRVQTKRTFGNGHLTAGLDTSETLFAQSHCPLVLLGNGDLGDSQLILLCLKRSERESRGLLL